VVAQVVTHVNRFRDDLRSKSSVVARAVNETLGRRSARVPLDDPAVTLTCVMTSGGAKDDDLLASDPELADLVRTLRSYGVLTRAELLKRSGARNWSRQGFDTALRRGIANGTIKDLSGGLFEVGPNVPDLDEGRFDPT
jgi:hypothetical protein